VLVAALLAAGYAFDSADGQLARMRSVGGPAGEWLDHVVDAVRMPAIHLAVLLALLEPSGDVADAVRIAAPLFCVVTFGQFMSQILAEQLSRQQGQNVIDETASDRRSWMLLLTDTGALLWSFVLWGWSNAFVVVYVVLLVVTAGYTLVSMRRKFRRLQALRA
jgi:phosphatidylglycerophosphate synthase